MQGHRSFLSALPENLSFNNSSSSSETGIDSQMSWNSLQTSAQNRLPECTISSNETNLQYLHHVRCERQNAEWCLGEGSSSAAPNQRDHSERKAEHSWSFSPRAALTMEERPYGSSNIFSLDSSNGNQTVNGSFHLQDSSSSTLPQDLNISSGFADLEDDDCQIVERPIPYAHVGPSNQQMPSSVGSSASFGLPMARGGYVLERDDRPGSSLDGRRVSCKRKALEIHTGQSSGTGNLNIFQSADRNQWHTPPPVPVAASNINMSTQAESNLVINNGLEPANPRLRLGVGGAVSANPFTLTASGAVESSRRNFRLRFNGSPQQDPLAANTFSADADIGNRDISSSRHSARLALHNRLFDLNPPPVVENGVPQVQYVPSPSLTAQTMWSGASSSRSSRSSASPIPGQRNATFYGEPALRNVPGSISEHPMFVSLNETRSSSQHPTNWHLSGGNNNVMGNNASSLRSGSGSRINSSAPTSSRRSSPQYPRRLSEMVRRSLLSSAGTEAGGQSSNNVVRPSSSVAPPEMAFSSASDNHGLHAPNSRSALLERHLDGVFGTPYSLRTLAAASEGRSSRMSEIRRVLDLMRRGEGLRLEDVMILDHSVLFGMADIHDRHRDMRLDVDNMSYEELLALEERIGNVCTGLTEETILNRLKQHKYVDTRAGDQMETEPCSICREEYNDGEDLGRLECGHDFHKDCVKQWLLQKNLCPICKTTGLTT